MAFRIIIILSFFLVMSCQAAEEKPQMQEFETLMAMSGHGVLFDSEGEPVELNNAHILELQEQIFRAVEQEKPAFENGLLLELADISKSLLDGGDIKENDRIAARYYYINALARNLNKEQQQVYLWRNDYLWRRYQILNIFELAPEFRPVVEAYSNWLAEYLKGTDYMQACRAQDVPIPPDFSINSTLWSNQGDLSTVLLKPVNRRTQLWTWADPVKKGACIALPRGSLSSPGQAGIICQSASTGRACFWDNISWDGTNNPVWSTDTIRLRQVQDARILTENCSDCHTGSNVFLIAPDDPKWCKVMRGKASTPLCPPMSGNNTHNFSLDFSRQVSGARDASRPYIPISGLKPEQNNWTNPKVLSGCAGSCHLQTVSASNVVQPNIPPANPHYVMVPNCSTGTTQASNAACWQ